VVQTRVEASLRAAWWWELFPSSGRGGASRSSDCPSEMKGSLGASVCTVSKANCRPDNKLDGRSRATGHNTPA